MEILLYGKPSYPYEYLKCSLIDTIKKASLDLEIQEIQEVSDFIKEDLIKIPAVKFMGEMKAYNDTNLRSFTENINNWILQKVNYGNKGKVIVPVDYSETSENALVYAKNFCRHFGLFIELFHSYIPRINELTENAIVDIKSEDINRSQFEKYTQNITETWVGDATKNIFLEPEFTIGFPGSQIIKKSKESDNNLIVIGSTGSNPVQKKLMGSVTTSVAQESKCPIIIVPPEAKYSGFKNVLYCCNDLKLDSNISPRLSSFISNTNSDIHLVHISEKDDYNERGLLEVWKHFYPKEKTRYNKLVSKPGKNILKGYCEKYKIDLVVIARPMRGFLSNLFHKSFTKEMVIYSNTPLLIINEN